MITYTGVQMSPGCGHAPCAKDIAVAMCRITRYAGALWVPLAAHSVIVAEFAYQRSNGNRDLAFCYGLLHDAHETVTGEVTRHYKPKEMKAFERELDEAIFPAFNLDVALYRREGPFYKEADELALTAEATLLGLMNWPTYYEKMEGHPVPVLQPDEESRASVILNYWRRSGMVEDGSIEQERLTYALNGIAGGNYEAVRRACIPGGWI